MRVVILHLSDFHITGADDPLIPRAPAIINAAQTLLRHAGACFIVSTGDLAFSGTDTQYSHVESFLRTIAAGISDALGACGSSAPVHQVLVPGNHDCDLSNAGQVREIVIDAVVRDATKSTDVSVVQTCTEPQDQFFDFANTIAPTGRLPGDSRYDRRLAFEFLFDLPGNVAIRFLCFNTAWLSRLTEQQGSLLFPEEAVPAHEAHDSLRLALFHHPYNWLAPSSARPFRKAIEANVDVVLTGHEHDPDTFRKTRASGALNTYVEGGVLQDSKDDQNSSFNVVAIDLASQKQLVTTFVWDGSRYSDKSSEETEEQAWEDFRANRLRLRSAFTLTAATKARLEDLGISILHPRTGPILLPQLYVFPDLRESSLRLAGHKGAKLVRGEDVVQFLALRPGRTLIIGDSESGKTALAKMLMLALLEVGAVPILLDGRDGLPTGDRLPQYLEDQYAAQYETPDRETYRQLSPHRRIIIVDDYHRLNINKTRRKRLFSDLDAFASRVILIGHDISGIESLAQGDPAAAMTSYRIQAFGHVRRNKLVERWLLLGKQEDSDTTQVARTLLELTRQLDDIVGKNFVPAYPPYVISVLQAAEAATPIDLRASTHGYFYELFIKTQLARGRSTVQYDILKTYLAQLAYNMFESRERTAPLGRVREWHSSYETRHDQRLDFSDTIAELVAGGIFRRENDEVRFAYDYIYYYFVAVYLHDHVATEETKRHIHELSRNLHIEENGNILLFLAHLSRDTIVIDEMLGAAGECYPDSEQATLDDDLAFVHDIEALGSSMTVYRDSDPSIERAALLERMDREAESLVEVSAQFDPMNPIVRLGVALKTQQILGQIVKNFPGSLEGNRKSEIVGTCFDLGLRALGWLFDSMRRNQASFLQECVGLITRQLPRLDEGAIVERAQRIALSLIGMASFGMVKRISMSVGSRHLEETYKRISDQTPIRRLIHLSIELDHAGEFPMGSLREVARSVEGKPMAKWVLRQVATQHVRLFPTAYATKQKVCAELEIRFEQLEAPEQPKLL